MSAGTRSAASETSGADFDSRRSAARNSRALERLSEALEHELEVPPAVTEVRRSPRGTTPLMSAEAFELARQVYYLGAGSMRDCARAIIAAGLTETSDVTRVAERLQTWWGREKWPKRPTKATFMIRDANHDGGLYRAKKTCVGAATGNGPAPKGKPCTASPLPDSEFCFQHDPRPEWEAARREQGERLRATRRQDMVPIEPFRYWLRIQRERLLLEARARGEKLDPKQTGWTLLADWLRVHLSLVHRVGVGVGTSTRATNDGSQIRAATVVKWLANVDTTFHDIYGFDPPGLRGERARVCPQCGEAKNPESKLCRSCHESQGSACSYVNRRGEQCGILTLHESGHCCKCRRILQRRANPRPRRGRVSFVSVPMLILAASEYVGNPNLRWVAERMWAVNAGGCADVFASRKSLESGLVKQFRKRGWSEPPGGRGLRRNASSAQIIARARAGLEELVSEHGAVPWPDGPVPDPESSSWVPIGPFRDWLAARRAEGHSYKAMADRIAISDDTISKIARGVGRKGAQRFVLRSTVDRALELWGAGETYTDLYGGRA